MSSPRLDEQLISRLPLPLAQLCRRAHNATTPLEQHLTAYYLWEASLKLLGAVAVVEYAALGDQDAELLERLKSLARPAVGHWWEFVRRLVPLLADRSDAGFAGIRDLLLGRARDDMPHTAELYAALTENGSARRGGGKATVRLTELFERLVHYRNVEIGHGVVGHREVEFYQRMGRSLLAGVMQVLGRIDVLAGRRLIWVGEVRRQPAGDWLADRYELVGESSRRIESLQYAEREVHLLPRPEQVYLEGPASASGHRPLCSLNLLIHYESATQKVYFLNARRGTKQIDYISYSSGEALRLDTVGEHRELLARVLGQAVEEADAEEWAARGLAEEPSLPHQEAAPPRRTVGDFELLSRLGQGGMGAVYRAWQPSLGRQVAVKCLLRSGDPKAEARFAREVRALARVDHPNLVKIHSSGTDDEQWYYSMELIEGAELAQVCEQLAGRRVAELDEQTWRQALTSACSQVRARETLLGETPSSPQPPAGPPASDDGTAAAVQAAQAVGGGKSYVRKVAEIMIEIAGATHALHEAGVVHRDIKPGNIMLSASTGTPVLMDLGLAQLADETEGRLTRTRQFVGTLRYASPEQVLAIGTLDRRTDVYSLGATLWELLSLRPLYGADESLPTPELMMKIQHTDPESVRRYNPHVPRDLDAIVQKCLHKDRARRYATAKELATDLRCFLAGEPITARPVGEFEKTWKWVKRNPVVSVLTAAIVLLLVGSSAGIYVKYLDAWKRKQEADELRVSAEEGEKEAERLRQAAEQFSKKARRTLDEAGKDDEKTRHVPGGQMLRRELMQSTLRFYKDFAAYYPEDESLRARLADTHLRLATATGRIRPIKEALKSFEEGTRILEELIAKDPENIDRKVQLGEAYFELGDLAVQREQYGEAEKILAKAQKLLEPLVEKHPRHVKAILCLAGVNHRLDVAKWYLKTSKPRESIAGCTRNVKLLETILDQRPDQVDALYWRGMFANLLAVTYSDLNQPAADAENLEIALSNFNKALRVAPDRPDVLFQLTNTLRNKAWSLRGQNRLPEALAAYTQYRTEPHIK